MAKVDVARYNLQLWSLAFTISATARPRIENNNEVSYPSECNDETIGDEENNQWPDIENSDDSSILDVDRGSHGDKDFRDGVGCGYGSVGGHRCADPSGFATCTGVSFRDDGLGDDVDQTSKHASPRAWIIPGAERYTKIPFSNYYGDCYKTTSWVEAYSGSIFLVGHSSDWNNLEDVQSKGCSSATFSYTSWKTKKEEI
ncbi:hypothetical protein Ddye_004849 [Dipteronia dyeriana]|uniref:Uncharacterized protein n=1 Tax=Dipteronia dyeriana TaxID=168575 RepID=A0AAE0CP54_9ROSI|nr:hypothetical protein Ddye_004849 [Dipteronia dyeriana]